MGKQQLANTANNNNATGTATNKAVEHGKSNTAAPAAVAVVAAPATALPNNATAVGVLPGALVTTHGVTVACYPVAPGAAAGTYVTCRSSNPQWPNFGPTPAVVVHPCTTGSGAAVLFAGNQLPKPAGGGMQGTKLWPYAAGQVQVAVCAPVLALLQSMARVDGAHTSLVALVAMLVAPAPQGGA